MGTCAQRTCTILYPVTSTVYSTSALFKTTLVASNVLHNVLCALAVCGLLLFTLVARVRRAVPLDDGVVVAGLLCIYFILVHMVLAPLPRYAVPIHGFLYLCGSVVLYELVTQGYRRARGIP